AWATIACLLPRYSDRERAVSFLLERVRNKESPPGNYYQALASIGDLRAIPALRQRCQEYRAKLTPLEEQDFWSGITDYLACCAALWRLEDSAEYEDAIREYEITLSLAPSSHETYMNLGAAYYDAKKPDKALEMFGRALSLSNSEAANRGIHARMGRIYLENRMWAEAARSLEKAVSGGGAGADLYNRLGIAYAQMGRVDMAVSAFKEAVALDPGNAGARRNLQMLLDSGAGRNAAR
ncbi:MAG: tetratricopeptide repeat protein, partial [Deltaproteobacteria bacterium]|nr:tetratricopeptide repeat protein [Deltaproteobacteria bacterium]